MAQCGTCVNRLYKLVIEEVISGVKENFLDEGIDDQVLNDLKHQWEAKLAATKAAEHTEISQQHQAQQQQVPNTQSSQQIGPSVAAPAMALVPVQITVPSQQAGGVSKAITIHVPSTALSAGIAGPQLQIILSSPAAAQTFALDATQAAEIIQRDLNTALQKKGIVLPPQLLQYNSQVDGPCDIVENSTKEEESKEKGPWSKILSCKSLRIQVEVPTKMLDSIFINKLQASQIDGSHGLGDSSDEISDEDEDDDDDDDDKDDSRKLKDDDDDEGEDEDTWNDEPLNTDDDVSDDDAGDIFETENVVVCQYDKITRVRNRWKFHLKDGIMNLKGKDYVFTKATGEGEW